jgi:hypothetical protein
MLLREVRCGLLIRTLLLRTSDELYARSTGGWLLWLMIPLSNSKLCLFMPISSSSCFRLSHSRLLIHARSCASLIFGG